MLQDEICPTFSLHCLRRKPRKHPEKRREDAAIFVLRCELEKATHHTQVPSFPLRLTFIDHMKCRSMASPPTCKPHYRLISNVAGSSLTVIVSFFPWIVQLGDLLWRKLSLIMMVRISFIIVCQNTLSDLGKEERKEMWLSVLLFILFQLICHKVFNTEMFWRQNTGYQFHTLNEIFIRYQWCWDSGLFAHQDVSLPWGKILCKLTEAVKE